MRVLRKTNGVISLFMAIIMLAMFTLTSILVDGSRIRSATALAQSAADSAAASVIAQYDMELKDLYGLFALELTDDAALNKDFLEYMVANMSGSYPERNTGEKFFEKVKEYTGLIKPRAQAFDMYGFKVDQSQVNGIYSIAEPTILENQIAEFAKYRAAVLALEHFTFLMDSSDELETASKDMTALEDSIPLREELSILFAKYEGDDGYDGYATGFVKGAERLSDELTGPERTKAVNLRNELDADMPELVSLAAAIEAAYIAWDTLRNSPPANPAAMAAWTAAVAALRAELDACKVQYTAKLSTVQPKPGPFKTIISGLQTKRDTLQRQYNELKTQAAQMVVKLKAAKARISHDSDATKNLKEEYDRLIRKCEELQSHEKQDWLDETRNKLDTLKGNADEIVSAVNSIPAASDTLTASAVQSATNTVKAKMATYISRFSFARAVGFRLTPTGTSHETEDMEDYINGNKDKDVKPKADEGGGEGGEWDKTEKIDSAAYNKRPSRHIGDLSALATIDQYADADEQYIREVVERLKKASLYVSDTTPDTDDIEFDLDNLAIMKFSQDSDDQSKSFNILSDFLDMLAEVGNGVTKSMIANIYDLSMFKSRVTRDDAYWKGHDYKAELEDSGHWVDREKELNLMFKNKREIDTRLYSEIEYILEGNQDDKVNNRNIYLKIYAMRIAINLIAFYTDTELLEMVEAATAAVGPFSPLLTILIMSAMAASETAWEMDYLITEGLSIPFLKKSDFFTPDSGNMLISVNNFKNMATNTAEDRKNTPVYKNGVFYATYENFLQLFLLLEGRNKKLLRTADLIQFNLQKAKKDEEYMFEEHKTYVRCYTEMSMKYMLMGYQFIPEQVEGNDVRKNGRRTIKTLNYHGY